MLLKDHVALITGAGQGIGRGSALAFAQAGADVVVVDINGPAVEETAAAVKALGRRSLALQADLGNVKEIDAMVAKAVAHFGRIDSLLNNAGVTRRAYIMDLTEEDWDRIHRVNAKGVFFCLQRVASEMIKNGGGRITNIASVAGKGYAGTSNAVYAASKGAVISLTKTAAQQLGQHNINVNAICPGTVNTAMLTDIVATRAAKEGVSIAEMTKMITADVPLRRLIEPNDIGMTAVFLASPAAHNISGQCLNVDAGLLPN
jgi:NAD(P)-dependent dehydrogenase (short-subunit alcohol dehydrogenase family)